MVFNLLSIWFGSYFGFAILEIDTNREDDMVFSLIGFSYDKEDKIIGIDIFYKYFEIKFKKNNQWEQRDISY